MDGGKGGYSCSFDRWEPSVLADQETPHMEDQLTLPVRGLYANASIFARQIMSERRGGDSMQANAHDLDSRVDCCYSYFYYRSMQEWAWLCSCTCPSDESGSQNIRTCMDSFSWIFFCVCVCVFNFQAWLWVGEARLRPLLLSFLLLQRATT